MKADDSRNALIDRCKAMIAEAYSEATEMIVAYLETHPDEARKTLCREIDPDNYHALDLRVARVQKQRKALGDTDSAASSEIERKAAAAKHRARYVLRDASTVDDPVVRELLTERVADAAEKMTQLERIKLVNTIQRHIDGDRKRTPAPKRGKPDALLSQTAMRDVIRDLERYEPDWSSDARNGYIDHEIGQRQIAAIGIVLSLMTDAFDSEASDIALQNLLGGGS